MTRIGEPPSIADGGARTSVTAVQPVAALQLDVHPSIAAGRRGAHFTAVVHNRSRAPVEARLSVDCGDGRLRAAVMPAVVALAPGEHVMAQVVLRARRPQLLRREVQHAAHVRARGAQSDGALTRRVVFVQARALPLWGLALLVALAAGAFVALGQLPDRVDVPFVEGAPDAATAERALRAAGLTLDPRVRSRTATDVRPGTIIDQIPEPGARATRGDPVSLLVAIGDRRAVTPALEGQTQARAAAILRAAGLSAGPVLPAGASAAAVVDSQLPAAGRRVPAGTAVTVVVREPPGAAGPSAAQAGRGGTANVPRIDGRDVDAYARAVAAAGLVPKVIRAVDPRAPGTLVGVRPKPGVALDRGARVRVLASAGVPRVAFDTGDVVRVFDPRSGRTERQASPPQGKAVEPSWTADGRRVLYRVGTRLLLVSARLADRGRVLYDGAKTKYTAATLAPAPAADGVVALVRRSGADGGDLCFARIGSSQLRPRCIADKRWDLGRQISWRRDGRELLVFGVRRRRPGTFGMLRYRTTRPFSTNPAHWRGAVATDTSVRGRGVIAAAYAPSGRDIALVTNIGLPRFQLLVTSARNIRDPAGAPLPVRACEVAWRPDGQELAVVQSDGDCSRPLGAVVRIDLRRPRATVTISSGGRHPAYQPLTYAGPKGLS